MDTQQEMWAVIQLMGHAETAGRISKPSEWGGLIRVDVPVGDSYSTEFLSMGAIYKVKLVSEEIARAYAAPSREVVAYDTPIVTREQHEMVVNELRRTNNNMAYRISQLERRLTATLALPLNEEVTEDVSGPEVDNSMWAQLSLSF